MNRHPILRATLRTSMLAAVTLGFALVASAQVNAPGSREERETDARALSAERAEKPATPADQALLNTQLQALIDAYERGDVAFFQAKLDPGMPGYSRVLDALRRDAVAQTRPRLTFTDRTWSIGANVAMLQARFEKRYFDARTLAPDLIAGRVVLLLARQGNLWRVSAVTGDNPFEARNPAPCSTGAIRLISSGDGANDPLIVEVDDSDLAGVPTILVDLVTARGDRETLTLNALTPDGRYRGQIRVNRLVDTASSIAGNGQVELMGDTAVTARYADQCTATSRAAQVVTATVIRRDPGTLGTLACRAGGSFTFASLAAASTTAATSMPLTIELYDPDLAGQSTVNVTVRTGNGDSETVPLQSVSNQGRFLRASIPAIARPGLSAAPGNGTLELNGPTTISAEYTDVRSGVVGRTQLVSGDCLTLASGYQLAQLSCTANATLVDLTPAGTPRLMPATLSVVDSDLAITNPAFINATLRNSNGDSEVVRLDYQSSGRYVANTVRMNQGTVIANNGQLDFPSTGSISMEYLDTTIASGGSQAVNQSCGNVTAGVAPAVLATMTFSIAGIGPGVPPATAFVSAPVNATCSILINDPEQVTPSVNVTLTAVRNVGGQTDTETLTIPRVSPGVYQRTSCQFDPFIYAGVPGFLPVPGNGIINLGGGATTVTVTYTDTTTPSGFPQNVSRTVAVTN
ncbi:MAG: hypothetical protein JNL19_07170 [Burkholderiales bacterium]|nr:hypothetical protein [Burkholderiales bacterium]